MQDADWKVGVPGYEQDADWKVGVPGYEQDADWKVGVPFDDLGKVHEDCVLALAGTNFSNGLSKVLGLPLD